VTVENIDRTSACILSVSDPEHTNLQVRILKRKKKEKEKEKERKMHWK
jgi:hypothetical protein